MNQIKTQPQKQTLVIKAQVYEVSPPVPEEVEELVSKKPPPEKTQPKKPEPPAKPVKKTKAVFGLSQKSMVSDKSNNLAIQVKKGNTLAKEVDQVELKDSSGALPIPTPTFKLSKRPRVIRDATPQYPEALKALGLQGLVILNVLIDRTGKVREVTVLKSLQKDLDLLAQKSMSNFLFSAAELDGKKVPSRIKYRMNFQLE